MSLTLRKIKNTSFPELYKRFLANDILSNKEIQNLLSIAILLINSDDFNVLKLRKKMAEMGEKESEREEFIRAIRKFMEMRTLTKQVLNELIDHIDVYETQGTGKNKTQRLVIYYKFVGYLDIDPTQCHPNYTADIREGVAVEYVSCEPTENLKDLFPEEYGEGDDFEEEETEQA